MMFKSSPSKSRYYPSTAPKIRTHLLLLVLAGLLFPASTLMADTPVQNGGFETPILWPNSFWLNPAYSGWSYTGTAGISANLSSFTIDNPIAPEGLQVLLLQQTGSASRTINWGAGNYRIKFKAAQRDSNQSFQTFVVEIDGSPIDTIRPAGSQYEDFQTPFVSLSSGSHTLQLRGINPNGGDNTVFIDDIKYQGAGLWSDPTIWPGGVVPGPDSAATILQGETVILDIDADIKNLTINGSLIADQNTDLNLSANWIMVEGPQALLEWGTEKAPYLQQATITLKHAPTDRLEGPTMKFLAARMGGRVEIHGEDKKGWTQLDVTADENTNTITLIENPGWELHDQIVIASTDYDPHQAEVRTITDITNGGLTLELDANLEYMHWGQLLTYDHGHTLDQRAEVGLLSRNIKIQGDLESETDGIGGHTMFMPNSTVHFSGVELYRMGQKDSLGRYPFHWHIAGDVNGQYIKNCSIHRSFNRVVTVHGTDYAVVEDNVGYDHIGHGYFLEDGNEIKNVFRRNLGILTRAPAEGEGVTPHDRVKDENSSLLKLPATFWITNPDNYFEGNVAAGSEGSGFWMVVLISTLGTADQIFPVPGQRDLLQFDDNRAHSTSFSNFSIDGNVQRGTNIFRSGHYRPFALDGTQIIPEVYRFTGYKTRQRNVWIRANTMEFHDCSLADSPRNTFFSFNQILYNSLIVGKSANIGNMRTSNDSLAGRSLPRPENPVLHPTNILSGHTVYDGPSGLVNVHFADFQGNNAKAFRINGAALKSTVHFAEGITFQNAPTFNRVWFKNQNWLETMYCSGLIDRDGSIVGGSGGHITPKIYNQNAADLKIREEGYNIEAGAEYRNDWFAFINRNEHFGLMKISNAWVDTTKYPTYNIRSDGPATYGQQLPNSFNMNPVIVNDTTVKYHWQYHLIPNLIKPELLFVDEDDFVISVFTNMPSGTFVYEGESGSTLLVEASSLSQLVDATTQQYFFEDNTIYVKHFATAVGDTAQYGKEFKHISPPIRLCQEEDCTSPEGNTSAVTFADFEMGIDGRMEAQSSAGLPVPTIGLNTFNPDDYGVYWTMIVDEDIFDEYTQVQFTFPRQVWTDFESLRLNIVGVQKFRALITDNTQGEINLGTYNSGTQVNIPLDPDTNRDYLDEVVKLTIRVQESDVGGPSATINLYDIKLSLTAPMFSSSLSLKPNTSVDFSTGHGVQLFPNPTQENFTLSTVFENEDELQLDIFDLAGRRLGSFREKVASGQWRRTFDIKRIGLQSGIYQVRLQTRHHGTRVLKLAIHE